MLFGFFSARRDTPIEDVRAAQEALLERLMQFETQPSQRQAVIEWSMSRSDLDYERLNRYFGEVFNRLDGEHKEGLEQFLVDACGLTDGSTFAWRVFIGNVGMGHNTTSFALRCFFGYDLLFGNRSFLCW